MIRYSSRKYVPMANKESKSMNKLEIFVAVCTEMHWLLLNIVTTVTEAFILPVHQHLCGCVIGVYRHSLEPVTKEFYHNL